MIDVLEYQIFGHVSLEIWGFLSDEHFCNNNKCLLPKQALKCLLAYKKSTKMHFLPFRSW
jgi:hypothetical protein